MVAAMPGALLIVSPDQKVSAAVEEKKLIYDEAGLLTDEEIAELNALANKLGAERETDIIVWTTSNPEGGDVKKLTQDFYDDKGPGYDKQHGNAVILTVEMYNREIYLAGFYKAETYLDNGRLDKIRDRITPSLTNQNYIGAFKNYIETAHRYMGFEPDVNPDNILFNGVFQLVVSAVIGGVIVGIMLSNSGGRVTVGSHTYQDANSSGLLEHYDHHVNTTVTKRKIERPSSGGGGGGGGGRTGGGHSHSGSRGSF
ncbi:TPM domain-containing protein [Paenibacillus sp. CAU 1782]